MVREFRHYVVREGSEAEHERLVSRIFDDLKNNGLTGSFTVYKLGSLYIHIICFKNESELLRFENLNSIVVFDAVIEAHLLEDPITNHYTEIGSYVGS